MKKEEITVIIYRLERARETLAEAELLLSQEHINTSVNRLYYSCFYAVSALLLLKGLFSSKHSGVRSLFLQNFIKTGVFDVALGKLFDNLYDSRQQVDYADLVRFDKDTATVWCKEVAQFIEKIENKIKEEIEI